MKNSIWLDSSFIGPRYNGIRQWLEFNYENVNKVSKKIIH